MTESDDLVRLYHCYNVCNLAMCIVTPVAMKISKILTQMKGTKKIAETKIVTHKIVIEETLILRGIARFSR